MRELNRMLGIKSKLSIVFYPQTDGQIERVNQKLHHSQPFRPFFLPVINEYSQVLF